VRLGIVLFCLLFELAAAAADGRTVRRDGHTLGQILADKKIEQIGVAGLKDVVTSYSAEMTKDEFAIAYVSTGPQGDLRMPLKVKAFDRNNRAWHQAEFKTLTLKEYPGVDCTGSVLALAHFNGWYYVETHLTPSAGCLIILNNRLELHDLIGGYSLAIFDCGVLVYARDMTHFARVHPATVFMYEPSSRTNRKLYPQADDKVREAFSLRLSAMRDEQLCRQMNSPCDPSNFETVIGNLAVNNETQAVAFEAQFSTAGFEDPPQPAEEDYVYVFRLKPFKWKVLRKSRVRELVGSDDLSELLKPLQLAKMF
jgi:hypothetical protein